MNQPLSGLQDVLTDAVSQGDLSLVKFLVGEKKMNVHQKYTGDYLLHLAVWSHNFAMVEYIIKAGANINKKNDEGRTALQEANELMYHDYTPDMRKIVDYLGLVTAQKRIKAKTARTKARAKLHTKIQQQTRRRFNKDISGVIASFLVGEPKRKHTFIAHQKKTANLKKFNARLRESAKNNGIKLTTQCAGKRKYKSDQTLRIQIANSRKRKSV